MEMTWVLYLAFSLLIAETNYNNTNVLDWHFLLSTRGSWWACPTWGSLINLLVLGEFYCDPNARDVHRYGVRTALSMSMTWVIILADADDTRDIRLFYFEIQFHKKMTFSYSATRNIWFSQYVHEVTLDITRRYCSQIKLNQNLPINSRLIP